MPPTRRADSVSIRSAGNLTALPGFEFDSLVCWLGNPAGEGNLLHLGPQPSRQAVKHAVDRAQGIWLGRDKTKKEGADALIITWTPRLQAVVARLLKLQAERNLKKSAPPSVSRPAHSSREQDGTPMIYEALSAACQRGVKRAKVAATMFRDLRAKALTDKANRDGVRAASDLEIHATEAQRTS
ncbi:MAG: hypothetical protein JO006_06095 [Paucibacter sp.]|nr:hypothetical protein [Roseateles sp.]